MPHDEEVTDKSEEQMLLDFEKRLEMPENVRDLFEQFQEYRDYLRDVMLRDDVDTVTTNLIYRNLKATLAQLLPTHPTVAFQPKRKLPRIPDPSVVMFGETNEIFLNEMADMGDWGTSFQLLAQAALTVPLVWGKLIWEEDMDRDPLGARRFNFEQDQIARYKYLKEEYEADEITELMAEYAELGTLEEWIIKSQMDELNLQFSSDPEVDSSHIQPAIEALLARLEDSAPRILDDDEIPDVATFQGFRIDNVDAEDTRWDWDLPSLEKWWDAGWVAHRVWMYPEDIAARWELTEAETAKLDESADQSSPSDSKNGSRSGTDTRDTKWNLDEENVDSNGRRGVWEMQNREDGHIYVFVKGMGRFLDKYQPNATHPKFFTLIPLQFNPIDGQPIGFSDVEMQMDSQDEYNELRTHEREARKSAYPRLLIGAGVMTDEEKEKYENALPYSVIEVEKFDEIQSSVNPLNPAPFDPNMFLSGKNSARMDMEQVAGLPASALGGMGQADLATEVAFAGEQLGSQMAAKRFRLNTFMGEFYKAAAHIAWQTYPRENVELIVGPEAFYPEEGRETLFLQLNLQMDVGANENPSFQDTLADITAAVQLLMPLGVQFNPAELAVLVFDNLNQRIDLTKLIMNLQPASDVPQPQLANQDGTPGPNPGTPGGGFTQTPAPESIPGG